MDRHFKPWTNDEDRLLDELYPTISVKVLAEMLGRSENAVGLRAHILCLKKAKKANKNKNKILALYELERIKDKVSLLRNSSELQPHEFIIDVLHLDWHIQQAEENLEFDWVIEDLQTQRNSAVERVKELEQQNKRYRESIRNALNELWVLNAYENDDSVCAAYKILIEALESESSE